MPITFHYRGVKYKDRRASVHKYWLNHVIKHHKCKTGNISFIFCDDEFMLGINKQFLDHDYYTDIITFNYNEKKVINADIYVSVDMVRYNALQYKVPIINEMRRVMVHGILHLLGYNDKDTKDIENMRKAEDKWMKWMELSTI